MSGEKIEDTQEWEIIEKQKILAKFAPAGLINDGIASYRMEYIIKNKKTGEIRRI